jgi:hypothetical protein
MQQTRSGGLQPPLFWFGDSEIAAPWFANALNPWIRAISSPS